MVGMREHVDGLHFCHAIFRAEQFDVTRLGGWVAAHVDDAFGAAVQELLKHFGMHYKFFENDLNLPPGFSADSLTMLTKSGL